MKKLFQLPFRRQLTVVLLLLSLLIALFTSIFSYQLAYRQFREMSIQLTQSSISMVRKSVDDYFQTIQECTTDILSSSSLRTLSNLSQQEAAQRSASYKTIIATDIRAGMAAANSVNVFFSWIEFYLQNGTGYTSGQRLSFSGYEDCLAVLEKNGVEISDSYIGTQWQILSFGSDSGQDLTCVRYIYNNLMERVGVAIFAVKPHELDRLFKTLGDAQIINPNGTVLASQDS